jgi:transposase
VTGSGVVLAGCRYETTAYRRNARGLRDRQAFEHVRMQAGGLFAAGHTQAEVARQLGVARQNVSRWHARWRQGGLVALASRGPTGPDPRLSGQQLHDLDEQLRQGARAHGFDTDHWTLARITSVIEQQTRPPLPSRPHLEAAAPHGLAAAAPRPPRGRARRAGDRPLGGRGLALGSAATPAAAAR